ncbi:MAG TPA: hypothetical protein VF747_12220 [Blastocatellia bacterium]|jgi:hypothetical protein
MFLLLFSLIQSQQPPRLSPFVIGGAVLAFLVGIGLLVYFFRRLRTSDKEAEEDWSLSRRSLFVSPEPDQQQREEVAAAEAAQPEVIAQATEELREEQSNPEPEPLREERPTQVLASTQPDRFIEEAEPVNDPAPYDEEIWAGLETGTQQSAPPAPPAVTDQGTQLLGSNQPWPSLERVNEQQVEPPFEPVEPPRDARVARSTGLENFEPPRIERMSQREPFEPPIIKPLTPREQSTFIENQRDSSPPEDLYAASPRDKKDTTAGLPGYGANIERQPPEREMRPAAQSLYEDGTGSAEPTAPPSVYPAPADIPVEPSVAAPRVEHARSRKTPAGSILGLPAEASQGPLILGEPLRSKEERGINALSNYGKPIEKDGGRGGIIALLLVILILGGALLAYRYIPSVNAGVDKWIAHVRGTDVEEARLAAMTSKAVIYPRLNSEVVKNQVKIKGAIDNISKEPLENLTVEVSLMRGADATAQPINVAVSPNPLPPNQRGTFDFEYDGKRDTGFTGYKITKLFSNGNEVKFSSPNAPK